MGLAITLVSAGGIAVTQSTSGIACEAVSAGGIAATLVPSGGLPITITNGIILSNNTIAENTANGATLGTASVPATYTGTPVWSLTDASGTFQINSSTGVITVLSNTALNYEVNTSLPITISVSGMTPSVPNYLVSIVITNVIEVPVNTVEPVIAGGTSIGSVLTVTSFGTWTDMQAGSFGLQWNNGADIVGATAASYTVQSGDSGDNIICKVTATNSASSATANSNSIGPIGSAPSTLGQPMGLLLALTYAS